MSGTDDSFDTAMDESGEAEARESAINDLETANECDRLAELVRTDDIEDQYREQALEGLGHPQCQSTLETLVEEDDLPESLRDRAETLVEEMPDDAEDMGDMGRL